MPGANDADIEFIQRIIIDSYGNLRGKDFARKRNLWHGVSQTETTRATLGTIDYLNKLKMEKRKEEEKGNSGGTADDATKPSKGGG